MSNSKIDQLEESFLSSAQYIKNRLKRRSKSSDNLDEIVECLIKSIRAIEESNTILGTPLDPIRVNRIINKIRIITEG